MRGEKLSLYQRSLALDEYYKLLNYVKELEQLAIPVDMIDDTANVWNFS